MNPPSISFSLREWQRHDIPIVYDMVVQLAVYEKEPDAVTTTTEAYYKAYDEGLIRGHLVILDSGKIVGMTLFYPAFSTWKGPMLYLEDFFVLEEYRKSGIGKLLFDAYVIEAKKRQCTTIKWQVLDWNTPAIKFYEKAGVDIVTNWWTCKKILP
ncbi:MAG: GNAT family N-acetyltransferase [Saprospiraceae bacterium]